MGTTTSPVGGLGPPDLRQRLAPNRGTATRDLGGGHCLEDVRDPGASKELRELIRRRLDLRKGPPDSLLRPTIPGATDADRGGNVPIGPPHRHTHGQSASTEA